MTNPIHQLIAQLPKTELHLHIEGTLEPELMLKLGERNKVTLPYPDVAAAKKAYNFNCLQEFLDLYYMGAGVLKTEQDFEDLTFAYMQQAKANNVKHAEIMFDPQTHTERGISFETVIKGIDAGLEKGEKELGVTSYLILSFLRHLSEEDAFKCLDEATPFLPKFPRIKAVGLDSGELGNPPEKFMMVYAKCREDLGLIPVAHAGEEGPVEYINSAIDILRVNRIDHGVRANDCESCMGRLVKQAIPLTTCPLSNICLKVSKKPEDNKTIALLRKGCIVTVNSDDPAYFGGYINANFEFLADIAEFQVKPEEIVLMCKHSFTASWLPDDVKAKYLAECDEVYKQWVAAQ